MFMPVNAPSERTKPTMNTSNADDASTESTTTPMQANASAAESSQLPLIASQAKHTPSTIRQIISPAAATDRKYAAEGSHEGMGDAAKSALTPLFLSCIIVPHAHRGTVMHEVAITPESIQLSENALTASSALTPNCASASVMPSDCILPINST